MIGEHGLTESEFYVTESLGAEPVVNFLANDEYGLLLSDALGGYSFNTNGQLLTKIGDAQALTDRPGRIIYVRDHDTGQFWAFSPGATPGPNRRFAARHGLGFSSFESEFGELGLTAKVFVPPSDPVELWELKLTNLGKIKRRLSLYIVVEWAEPFDSGRPAGNGLVATSRRQTDLAGLAGFDHTLDSFETDPARFFGRSGGYTNPRALEDGRLSRTQGQFGASGAIAVLEKKITLGSRASFELASIFGLVNGPRPAEKAKRLLLYYSDATKRAAAWAAVSQNWQTVTSRQQIKTPDEALNQRYNSISSYQGELANRWPGLTSYGDKNVFARLATAELAEQIRLGLTAAPSLAQDRLTALFGRQFKDGGVIEEWTSAAHAALGAASLATIGLLGATAAYVNETGELAFLKNHQPFLDGGSGSVHEHLNRAIAFLRAELSPRQLLTSGRESLLLTAQFTASLETITPIFEAVGDHQQASSLLALIEKLRAAINKQWTGHGYPRELTPVKIGFPNQKFHQLDLATQCWAVIARAADPKRMIACLNAVKGRLVTKLDVVDFTPPYEAADSTNPLSFDQPGRGRNGAITVENNLGCAQALALVGDGDNLARLLAVTGLWLPATIGLNAEKTVRFGAPVALQWQKVIVESLAGVTATLGGLKINPCLPRDWRRLEINRHFRGAEYQIRVMNPLRVATGVERIFVDGTRLTGTVIPPFRGGTHRVEVFLG